MILIQGTYYMGNWLREAVYALNAQIMKTAIQAMVKPMVIIRENKHIPTYIDVCRCSPRLD